MKKIIFSFVCLFLLLTSCKKENSLNEPTSLKDPIVDENAVLKSGSIYLPTCSDGSTGTTMTWSNSTLNVNLSTHSTTNQKYIYRAVTASGGAPRFFKVRITNKSTANYPIVVRAVGQEVIFGPADDLWFVVNDNNGKCSDLLTYNATRLFDNPNLNNPDTGNRANYVQFEIIVPNRSSTGKTNTSVPVEIKLSSYTSAPWFGFYKKKNKLQLLF